MDNKQLGIGIIVFGLAIAVILSSLQIQLNEHSKGACSCSQTLNGGACPAETGTPWGMYSGIFLIALMTAMGVYLVFFEKSQKEIVSVLEKQKKIQTEDEKFAILNKAMDDYEKRVIKAIREQDGITQSTLRFRTDLSKSKLSSILSDFEKKGLVKREKKGKTFSIFLK